MFRTALALSSALLLLPTSALAFASPSELFEAIQESPGARSFSLNTHGGNKGIYVSIWAHGSEQGSDIENLKLQTNATIDIVNHGKKLRIKGEFLMVNGMAYFRLLSAEGVDADTHATLSALSEAKRWIAIPLTEDIVTNVSGNLGLGFGTSDLSGADTSFELKKVQSQSGNRHTLTLTQGAAILLAQSLRDILQDSEPISDDFFPWQALADSVEFLMTVETDAEDTFLGSTFRITMKNAHAYFSAEGTKKRLNEALTLEAPEDAVMADQFLENLNGLDGFDSVPANSEVQEMEDNAETPKVQPEGRSNTTDPSCSEAGDDPVKMVQYQRMGICPTVRVPTRAGEYR